VEAVPPDRDWREPDTEGSEPEPEAALVPDPGDAVDEPDDPTHFEDPGVNPAGHGEPGGGSNTALPGKVESWRKRSATGAVLTGIAFGLQQIFEKEREEPAIIMTTSGDPPRDLPVEAEVEHGRPRRSVVNIRPWLLDPGATRRDTEDRDPRSGADSDPARDVAGSAQTNRDDERHHPGLGSSPEGD
jgi:hypothetical protein